ncbi:hypothetical protein [Prevotella melaninogenica]
MFSNTLARVTLCEAARVVGVWLAFSLMKASPGCQGKVSSDPFADVVAAFLQGILT